MDVSSEDPFKGLKIDSHEPLHRATARARCPDCGSSRKYFCYQCHIPMEAIAGKFQTVKLPLKVDIIKHALELDGKSTAVHARILAPDHVTIYTYPNIPQYDNKEKLLLVFPCKKAISLEQLMEQHRISPDEPSGNRQDGPRLHLPSHNSNAHLGSSEHSTQSSQLEPKRSETTTVSSQTDVIHEVSDAPRCSCQQDEGSLTLSAIPSERSADEINHSPAKDPTLVDPGKGLVHSVAPDEDNRSHRCHQKCENTLPEHLGGDAETNERDEAHCGQHAAKMEKKAKIEEGAKIGEGAKIEEASKTGPFERVIFIDCTWNQTGVFSKDERLAGIKSVILEDRLTTFWRKQYRKPQTYLATIEAIYYFMVDFHKIVLKDAYAGQYDNLLYFYSFMYHLVQETTKEREKIEHGKR